MNTFHQNRDDMQKDVDVSGAYQPDGPIKGDVPVAAKPDHVDFQVVRNEALIQLNETLEELKSAKEAFVEFKSISAGVEEERRAWSRRRPEEDGRNHAAIFAWKNSDPELCDLPAIRAAEIRVRNLKEQLAEAESALGELQAEGTPRQKYVRSIFVAWSAVNGLANGLKRAAIEDILFTLYKTRNFDRLPDAVIQTARVHPDVLKFEYQITQLMDPNRDSFGDLELASAFTRAVAGIERLVEIIKG
jgi:hypothetical protein